MTLAVKRAQQKRGNIALGYIIGEVGFRRATMVQLTAKLLKGKISYKASFLSL